MCQVLSRVLHAGHCVPECGGVDTRKYRGAVKKQFDILDILYFDNDVLFIKRFN